MDSKSKKIKNCPTGGVRVKELKQMVTERAYLLAKKRGFAPGHELDDWLEAELEVGNQCFYWNR